MCDRTNNRLQVFRKDGTFVSEHVFEKDTRGNGTVYDLVFSPDAAQKYIYMIDGMNGEVRVVDRASKETLGRFGRPGRQAGQFTALHNIAVDRQGNIYTAEVQYRAAGAEVPAAGRAGLRGIDFQRNGEYDHGHDHGHMAMPEIKTTKTIKASEFKAKCLALMDEVARTGERMVITKNGEPVAEFVPHKKKRAHSAFKGQSTSLATSCRQSMSNGTR